MAVSLLALPAAGQLVGNLTNENLPITFMVSGTLVTHGMAFLQVADEEDFLHFSASLARM
jgi:hypothetical protein